MDPDPARRVALMSIHPEYAEAILSGTKRVEFRKRRLAPDIDTVVVYATAPVQRVVGTFTIDRTIEGAPEAVWRDVGPVGGISRETFDRYFQNSARAVGLVVRSARRWQPIPLAQLDAALTPPQSFAYIPARLLSAGAVVHDQPHAQLPTLPALLRRLVTSIRAVVPHRSMN